MYYHERFPNTFARISPALPFRGRYALPFRVRYTLSFRGRYTYQYAKYQQYFSISNFRFMPKHSINESCSKIHLLWIFLISYSSVPLVKQPIPDLQLTSLRGGIPMKVLMRKIFVKMKIMIIMFCGLVIVIPLSLLERNTSLRNGEQGSGLLVRLQLLRLHKPPFDLVCPFKDLRRSLELQSRHSRAAKSTDAEPVVWPFLLILAVVLSSIPAQIFYTNPLDFSIV